jgi:hypothetical protein
MTTWQDTVMLYSQIETKFAMTPDEVMWQWLVKEQARISFEAGQESKVQLVADLQETVNRMLQDNSELTVALEHAQADERKAASQLVGHYLRQKVQNGETVIAETRIMWLEEAILKGERPNG